ncbi:MAG: PP2C family protein-serine/threonine phosphatase [Bacteroidia bacterium]|jgi:serine/threonine protein phosphatase PrpC
MIQIKAYYTICEQGGRKNNQDAVFPEVGSLYPSRLYMVCDGVGGNLFGDAASYILCKAISQKIGEFEKEGIVISVDQVMEGVRFGLAEMRKFSDNNEFAENMATTLSLLYINENNALAAWCGDSPVYHMRGDKVLYRTKDHSEIQKRIDRGELTPEEAKHAEGRNVILEAVKLNSEFKIDFALIDNIQKDDIFLLCSDGLLEQFEPTHAHALVNSNGGNRLIEEINKYCRGKTKDNYSMQLVVIGERHSNANEIAKTPKLIFGKIGSETEAALIGEEEGKKIDGTVTQNKTIDKTTRPFGMHKKLLLIIISALFLVVGSIVFWRYGNSFFEENTKQNDLTPKEDVIIEDERQGKPNTADTPGMKSKKELDAGNTKSNPQTETSAENSTADIVDQSNTSTTKGLNTPNKDSNQKKKAIDIQKQELKNAQQNDIKKMLDGVKK